MEGFTSILLVVKLLLLFMVNDANRIDLEFFTLVVILKSILVIKLFMKVY